MVILSDFILQLFAIFVSLSFALFVSNSLDILKQFVGLSVETEQSMENGVKLKSGSCLLMDEVG